MQLEQVRRVAREESQAACRQLVLINQEMFTGIKYVIGAESEFGISNRGIGPEVMLRQDFDTWESTQRVIDLQLKAIRGEDI